MTEKWWAVRVVNEKHPDRNGWRDANAWWSKYPCCMTREQARRIKRRYVEFGGSRSYIKRITVEYD
jgi:hypothetical protein